MRYILCVALAVALVTGIASTGSSEEFPSKVITAIVPFGPGGGTDRSVRILSMVWEKYAPVQMRVVNMPGAASSTGQRHVLNSVPDGHTIVQNGSAMLTLPYFFSKEELGWVLEEFEPIAVQSTNSYILTVPEDSPFKTLADVIEFGKANPGKLRHGVVGYGSDSHVAFKQLELAAGFSATVVPFDSGADQVSNILGGHLDVAAVSVGSMLPSIGHGARALAVGMEKRHPGMPDIPTAKELGIDWIALNWRGWLAPPKTPRAAIDYIADVIDKAVKNDLGERIVADGEDPTFMGPDEFREFLVGRHAAMGPALRAIQAEEAAQ